MERRCNWYIERKAADDRYALFEKYLIDDAKNWDEATKLQIGENDLKDPDYWEAVVKWEHGLYVAQKFYAKSSLILTNSTEVL